MTKTDGRVCSMFANDWLRFSLVALSKGLNCYLPLFRELTGYKQLRSY
jgi:hypothetical protein